MTKQKPITREKYEELMQLPPFNYCGHTLEMVMKNYDNGEKFSKTHPRTLPEDMQGAKFTGRVSMGDELIEIECVCGEGVIISNNYITLCEKCGRGYKLVSYVAQYEKKPDVE